MFDRKGLERMVYIAKLEYTERGATSVKILRLKNKNVLTQGVLPNYQSIRISQVAYLIVADYRDQLKVWPFTRNGTFFTSQNVPKEEKLLQQLHKSTTTKYQLPKKEPREDKDLSLKAQRKFKSLQNRLMKTLGISFSYPRILIIDPTLSLEKHKEFGCRRTRKEMRVSAQLLDDPVFEVFSVVEYLYEYLIHIISLDSNISRELSLLFTSAYLGFVKTASFLEYFSPKFSQTEKTSPYRYINIDIRKCIKSWSASPPYNLRIRVLKALLSQIQLLGRYGIRLMDIEQLHLLLAIQDAFQEDREWYTYVKYPESIDQSFLLNVFCESLSEIEVYYSHWHPDDLAKTRLLCTLLGFGQNMRPKHDIMLIHEYLLAPPVKKSIKKVEELVSHCMNKYIENKAMIIRENHTIINGIIDLRFELMEDLQDLSFSLLWRPEKQLELINQENIKKSKGYLNRKYEFKITYPGFVRIYFSYSLPNPIYPEKIIQNELILTKISC